MLSGHNEHGFTLIELVLVIVLVGVLAVFALPRFADLSDDATESAVRGQARALIDQNTINAAACRVGGSDCVDIVSTGTEACEDALETFLPELDLESWSVRNIDSSTPRDQWSDELQDGEALYWVTRFLGDDTSNHPSDSWFDTWNPTQPCALSRVL